MVAVIHSGSSLRSALNYNEKKVQQEAATCLAAVNYPIDADRLTFNQKLNRLQYQADLNTRTKVNCVHISLNFDPSEKLQAEQLKEIADIYLQKIGFENQPYLLYEHNDAGHPHVHIVTTNIKADGKRIELHNVGRNQSEKARKEIEIQYGLVKAEDSKQRQVKNVKPVNIQRLQYGRSETKKAISVVLNTVLNNYKFSSLPELNAVLQQYNVLADRGSEDSRIFQNKGLVYRVVDGSGNKLGVPVKASDFYNKPTLQFLETKFLENETAKQPFRSRVKNAIDLAFIRQKELQLAGLTNVLEREGIDTVLRQNSEGLVYGITYVDYKTKCVFNGSDLGKQYSAKAILERCNVGVFAEQRLVSPSSHHLKPMPRQTTGEAYLPNTHTPATGNRVEGDVLKVLLKAEYTSEFIPNALKNNGRKKKKKSKSQRL